MSRGKRIANRIIVLAAVLLGLTLLSSRGIGSIYAKYTTGASWSDGARVARFAVSAQGAEQTAITLDASGEETGSYAFTVSNQTANGVNETATDYDVVVTFPCELKGVTLTLRNRETTVNAATTDNVTYTFDDVGTFPAGTAQTDQLTLTFTMAEGAESGSWENIKIEVHAAQLD